MAKYSIAIDINRCSGCGSCLLACKDEYTGNSYLPLAAAQPNQGHKWLRLNEIEQGQGLKVRMDYIPIMCQHCENPPCAFGEPEGAVYKRSDGIVIIDPEIAKGRKDMVNKCPYGAIFWNEELQLPQKCILCAHMLDSGETKPRCVEACPSQALIFGDLEDKNSEISKYLESKNGHVEEFKPEFGSKPQIRYIDLPKPFIAGEIMLEDSGECIKGARVGLVCDDCGAKYETETDFFGDFYFKGLKQSANYTITAGYPGYFSEQFSVKLNAAKNVGEIVLRKK